MSKVVAITGANRGIGLALVKQFLKNEENQVIAGVRNPAHASELKAWGNRVDVTALDVSDPESIDAWAKLLKEKYAHIDVIVNNAGVFGSWPAFGAATKDEFVEVYSVNTFGPFFIIQSLFCEGLIGGEVSTLNVVVSSVAGSNTEIPSRLDSHSTAVSPYIYSSSKAAANMLVTLLGRDLKDKNIVTVAIHPGIVATDMNSRNYPGITPEESAEKILHVLYSGKELRGQFYSYDGSMVPW